MSPECQNCGSVVTSDYARVFTPDGVDAPRCCPRCPDLLRDTDGTVREARSRRDGKAQIEPREKSGGEA